MVLETHAAHVELGTEQLKKGCGHGVIPHHAQKHTTVHLCVCVYVCVCVLSYRYECVCDRVKSFLTLRTRWLPLSLLPPAPLSSSSPSKSPPSRSWPLCVRVYVCEFVYR